MDILSTSELIKLSVTKTCVQRKLYNIDEHARTAVQPVAQYIAHWGQEHMPQKKTRPAPCLPSLPDGSAKGEWNGQVEGMNVALVARCSERNACQVATGGSDLMLTP